MCVVRPTQWPTIEKGLLRASVEYREKGFCTSFEHWQRDVWGIARSPLTHAIRMIAFVLGVSD